MNPTRIGHDATTVNICKESSNCSLQLNRWFLKLISVWPKVPATSATEKILLKILRFLCHTLIALYCSSFHTVYRLREKGFSDEVKDCGTCESLVDGRHQLLLAVVSEETGWHFLVQHGKGNADNPARWQRDNCDKSLVLSVFRQDRGHQVQSGVQGGTYACNAFRSS